MRTYAQFHRKFTTFPVNNQTKMHQNTQKCTKNTSNYMQNTLFYFRNCLIITELH